MELVRSRVGRGDPGPAVGFRLVCCWWLGATGSGAVREAVGQRCCRSALVCPNSVVGSLSARIWVSFTGSGRLIPGSGLSRCERAGFVGLVGVLDLLGPTHLSRVRRWLPDWWWVFLGCEPVVLGLATSVLPGSTGHCSVGAVWRLWVGVSSPHLSDLCEFVFVVVCGGVVRRASALACS